MLKIISKFIIVFLCALLINTSYVGTVYAADHTPNKQLIKKLKKEINELGAKPVKKKGIFSKEQKRINQLEAQLEKLKKIEALKIEIKKELEALGEKPPSNESKELEADEQIVELRKLLDDAKAKNKAAENKKKTDAKEEEKAEEKKQARLDAIEAVRKEILFLGETPMAEYEFTSEDKFIAALREQLEEVKKIKEEEEFKINAEIPEWYVDMPGSSETILYSRGSAISADLDNSEQRAVENAIIQLAQRMKNRINQKVNIMAKEAGVDGDLTLKRETKRITTIVVKDASIRGYKIFKTKMAGLSDGKYRTFIVIEYPISLAYKNFIAEIDSSLTVKANISKLKNTDAFKELEEFVSQFTGA